MVSEDNYKVAIDILRCHLGMSVEEAHKELGINQPEKKPVTETKTRLIGLTQAN
jgi:hypothetical protein